MKVRVELELDMDGYKQAYGHLYQDGDVPIPDRAVVEDALQEAFWDWHSKGLMKLRVVEALEFTTFTGVRRGIPNEEGITVEC